MNPGKLISLEPLIRDKEQTDNHTITKERREKDARWRRIQNMTQNKKEKQNDKGEIKYRNREKRGTEDAWDTDTEDSKEKQLLRQMETICSIVKQHHLLW